MGGGEKGYKQVEASRSKKLKGAQSNAVRSGNTKKSRLGNASNVLEVPRPRAN